jgi:hypothetical protein
MQSDGETEMHYDATGRIVLHVALSDRNKHVI